MVDFTNASLDFLVIHKVGNKLKQEGYLASNSPPILNEQEGINAQETLMNYFLKSFNYDKTFQFFHTNDLKFNEVYTYCNNIFADKNNNFTNESINILTHLYNQSDHPNIKSGELYITYLSSCLINGKLIDAIGIFKSENKDIFLQVEPSDKKVIVNFEKGIHTKKLDKGALILNLEKDKGYQVFLVDTSNKKIDESKYWKEDFLGVTDITNDSYYTQKFLNICKEYSKTYTEIEENQPILKKVNFLNKAIEYLEDNTEFQLEEFTSQVFEDKKSITSFENLVENNYSSNHQILTKEFSIEPASLKREIKRLNETIKLDDHIEIKIKVKNQKKSNRGNIEKGFDQDKNMHYYKIFFNKES
ncbi:nucleoid-associated protein [Bacillus nakamurai]|uniref:nucleoid-associated protein n=1 Tax=Bacillus nakamurai TaxID=1793963 RepID=UPI0020C38BF7|nr:nucleoid-associated protein [Bacillus nakamurai]MCP6682292.1 nucleoid-associated protein [Bacillus nakamurai]